MGNDPSRRAKSSGLSGFVSFKRRKDAEVALRELDGTNWAGSALRVGWSKAVPTSGRVLYGKSHKLVYPLDIDPLPGRRNSRSRSPEPRRSKRREPSHSSSRSRSQSSDYDHYRRSDRPRSRDKHDRHRRSRSRSRDRSHRKDRRRRSQESHRTPRDERDFIELVATMRRAHGKTFEDSLLERERGNPQYEFLYDPKVSKDMLSHCNYA
jgi:U2-associated protein SR140